MADSTISTTSSIQKYDKILDELSISTGAGGVTNATQQFFTEHDRFKANNINSNTELTGLTFITRPKLNLSSINVKQSSVLTVLNTMDPRSIQYAIRCMLDHPFALSHPEQTGLCPLINDNNPFIVPACTALQSISGFPDLVMNTKTTQGGYHSENQIYSTGSDGLTKNYDMTMQFMDIQNSPLLNMFRFWFEYTQMLLKGDVVMYPEDINMQRMCYTFSVYRFLMDPTSRYITGYAKATGCMMSGLPMGAKFNVANNETISQAAKSFSVPFSVNKIEYNDQRILTDFNRLVRLFCPKIESYKNNGYDSSTNYSGIPYLGISDGDYNGHGYELLFKYKA